MSKGTKKFVIIVGILVLIIAGFTFLGGNDLPKGTSGLTNTSGMPVLPAGEPNFASSQELNEFSSVLSTVKSISIDTSIFQRPSYKALKENPIVLGSDVIGRPNPFAAIGSDSSSSVTAPVLNIQTIQPGKITGNGAEFAAQLTLPNSSAVSFVFEYGTSDSFGSSTPELSVTQSGTKLYTISGLAPATTYYVRAVVTKGSSTPVGNTMTFTTTSPLPR